MAKKICCIELLVLMREHNFFRTADSMRLFKKLSFSYSHTTLMYFAWQILLAKVAYRECFAQGHA